MLIPNQGKESAMKKKIFYKYYDTDNATLLKRHCEGSEGDPYFASESLYIQGREWFLYCEGGECSRYGKAFGGTGIIPLPEYLAFRWYRKYIVGLG